MEKYTKKEYETCNGFWSDIEDGYINPENILTDQDKALELKQAIKLLKAWHDEMVEDGFLKEF
jgi:hypothetical protein